MEKRIIKPARVVRALIFSLAFLLFIWVNLNYFTAGTVIGSVLCGGAMAICVFWMPFCGVVKRIWSKLGGKIALLFVGAFTAFCVICCVIFSVNMTLCIEKPLDDAGAVIVLGCQVNGETPSVMLARRCDAALETLSDNSEAICVVSGGKGKGEDISEAEAMRRYLTERGIAESRVIIEDRSTSTKENIEFTAELLEERGIDRAVIVTNDFHQYRADIYARRSGLTAGHHSNKTPLHNLANYWVREWAALMKQLIVDS